MPGVFVAVGALLVALAVDRWWGEPPARWHPVVWMGNALERCAPWVLPSSVAQPADMRDWNAFGRGAVAWLALAVLVVAVAGVVQGALLRLPDLLAAVLLGLALKPLLAWRMLRTEVLAVEAALQDSLEQGRERLGWLVSRDVSQLTASQVRESAIESLAENLNDSVVAPLFWFVLLGLPGAALYRLANTADAMWGYRGVYQGRRWEWAGKWAARVDDGLSWLPARLTAAALALVGGGVPPRALVREAGHTPSPNSGWPMAAMALALGVCLHKPGVYALNRTGRAPQTADTERALLLATNGLVALVSIALTAIFSVALLRYLGGSA
mgnify:CR=1 FL=1|jgi:adenosylcobinamide-phosphate synthase